MITDPFGRTINYLRVSVTDRCNLRCRYCMEPEGVSPLAHDDILSYEDIAAFVRTAAGLGIEKVRITGGEPLVRKGIVALVEQLAAIDGIRDLALTTNGTLLERFAQPMADAGLMRINVSLDSLSPERYAHITRGGDVGDVLRGLDAARAAGLSPIKLNCVVTKSTDEPDAVDVKRFALKYGYEARFIPKMTLAEGSFGVVHGGSGGHCRECNRLRLSSDGFLRPCLFNDAAVNIRSLPWEEAIRKAVELKPQCGTGSRLNRMSAIGG